MSRLPASAARRDSTPRGPRGGRRTVLGALALGGATLALPGCSGAGPGEPIGTTSSAITFPNDQPAFDYFVGKGLTPAQAAGVVGNLDQESGVDPTAVESGGPGRGIAQWSVGGRWDTDANDNATWYAAQQGQPLLSLQLQLDFIWYELTTFPSYGLAALEQATSVTDATVAFQNDFEGCGTCDQSQRIAYAENVLAAFGSDAGAVSDASGGGPGDAAGAPCTVTTTGESGVCLEVSACAALGGHDSTPGYCPGPANVQCCTAAAPPDDDAATADASRPAHPLDAGPVVSRPDAASTVPRGDAAATADGGGFAGSSGGGCTASRWRPPGPGAGVWLAALTTLAARRRRRARGAAGP